MLVLTRKRGERLRLAHPDGSVIGHVSVQDIRGDKVRVGLHFPRSIQIDREEIVQKKNPEAVRTGSGS